MDKRISPDGQTDSLPLTGLYAFIQLFIIYQVIRGHLVACTPRLGRGIDFAEHLLPFTH